MFSEFFWHRCKCYLVWNRLIAKNHLNLTKIFLLKLFKMAKNQTDHSRFEQKSVIRFLMAKKCKPCHIYTRMCDVWRKTCFSQKMFTNRLNIGLLLWDWMEKTVHRVETHWLSSKEKVLGAVVSKEGHADSVLGHEKTHHYWFTCKQCFLGPIP